MEKYDRVQGDKNQHERKGDLLEDKRKTKGLECEGKFIWWWNTGKKVA